MSENIIVLLGHPIAHSKSPMMHNAAFQALQMPYEYRAIDVAPGQLADTIVSLKDKGLRGANVTLPYKVAIQSLLDDMTPLARRIGAVNTVYVDQKERLIGDNTDGLGYVASLVAQFPQLQLRDISVGIVGAGGAARAIAFTLAEQGVQKIFVTNRTMERAEQLVQSLKDYAHAETVPFQQFERKMSEIQLLIQTTSIGMSPNVHQSIVPDRWLHEEVIVSDIVYNPRETMLLRTAKSKGARLHDGAGMLLYQGALSFERWTGIKAPIEIMKKQLFDSLHVDYRG